MATTKQHEKLKLDFPDFNFMNYDHSLIMSLNFYNLEVEDSKKKKEWALQYWKNEGKDVKRISKISDGYFQTVGAVAHMIHYRNIELDEHEVNYMSRKFVEFNNMNQAEEKQSSAPQKEDKLEAELNLHIGEFEGGVDMFFQGKEFDSKSYLIRSNVKPSMMKQIGEHFKPFLRELKLVAGGKDEQLTESYEFLSPRKLKKFIEYVQSIISSCEVAASITKASRAPRAKKVKAPTEIVKSVKYMIEDPTTKIKSEHPSKIVNAKEAWIYNAKNRRLFRYIALDGMSLSVKGVTICNIDQEKSGGKIVRKPESQLKGAANFTSRPFNKLFNDIRGTMSRAAGRLNEDTLILKCFN